MNFFYEVYINVILKKVLVLSFSFRSMLFLVVLFTSLKNYAQNTDEQLSFTLSNDKFADRDQYFTNGVYFNYYKLLPKTFILPKKEGAIIQLNIGLGNEIFSPTGLSSFSNRDFDRSFAGWLFVELEVGSIKEKSAFFLSFETGITGEESLSGKLQVGFHDLFGIDSRPTWVDEIPFKWLFNFKTNHIFDVVSNQHHGVQYRVSPSLGTKDIYLENEISYYFGKLNNFQNSSRTRISGDNTAKEFFGYIALGHKYVVHNTIIQGSIFNNNEPFTTGIENHVFKTEIGAVLQSKRNFFKVFYNYNTKENSLSTSHIYGSLAYARSF